MSRGADIVANALEENGVSHLFSVSGNHLMSLYDATLARRIQIIHGRHEAACVHMADAWGRLTGLPGIVAVTAAQGHANAAAALYTALAAESPVVLLSGHAPLGEIGRGSFQEMDQVTLAQPVTKASWMVRSAATLSFDIAKAFDIATAGRPGPVHLSLPVDLLDNEFPNHQIADMPRFTSPPTPKIDALFIDRLKTRINAAKSPLIICGPALCNEPGRSLMRRAAEELDAPIIGMESPRGVNDPSLGALSEVLGAADLIVLFGKPLDFTLKFGGAPFAGDCQWIVLNPDSSGVERAQRRLKDRLVMSEVAEPRAVLHALIEHAAQPAAPSKWRQHADSLFAYSPPAWDALHSSRNHCLHPVEMCRPIADFVSRHPKTIFVTDGGEISQWAQAIVKTDRRIINGVAGAIGPAIPSAIAAKILNPDGPVIVAMGDGTFGFHMAELDTALRYDLPFIVVVGNDARWNAEYQIQVRDYGEARAKGCELLPTRYDLVAEGLGCFGALVTQASELPEAIERAYRSGKPACINVMIEGVPAPVIRR